MRTKFIKVSTADRLPKKQGTYLCKIKDRTLYCKQIFWNQKDFIEEWRDGIEYWLEKKPDHEEEMREMLEKVCTELYKTDNPMATEVKTLLTKIKQ